MRKLHIFKNYNYFKITDYWGVIDALQEQEENNQEKNDKEKDYKEKDKEVKSR